MNMIMSMLFYLAAKYDHVLYDFVFAIRKDRYIIF